MPEAQVVGSQEVVSVGQGRDQVAEHARVGGKAVEQDHDRRITWPGLAVEDPVTSDDGGPVMNSDHFDSLAPGWVRMDRAGMVTNRPPLVETDPAPGSEVGPHGHARSR